LWVGLDAVVSFFFFFFFFFFCRFMFYVSGLGLGCAMLKRAHANTSTGVISSRRLMGYTPMTAKTRSPRRR
jgi:hypothetical protein